MAEYIEIEGSNDLILDMNSHAVINKNRGAKQQILAQREKRKQDAKDLATLKNEVSELKNTMAAILSILEKK